MLIKKLWIILFIITNLKLIKNKNILIRKFCFIQIYIIKNNVIST